MFKIYNLSLINFGNKLNLNLKNLSVPAFFLKSLLGFRYFKYIWVQLNKANYRNVRSANIAKYHSALLGYKLAFKGRFSRKQRSSNI
jgi:hypothetical protein